MNRGPLKKPVKAKFTMLCEWCKKEKVGKRGKYHKWCSYDAQREQAKTYGKSL